MKITKKMSDALNDQFAKEMFSAYLYAAMSADCTFKGRKGSARWFFLQSKEELDHARKIYEFMLDRGAKPVYAQLDKPQESWDTLRKAFEASLAHEQFISDSILNLVKTAKELDDTPTEIFLQWFVTEQIEEEAAVEDVLTRLEQVGEDNRGLYMLDRELGARE